MNSLLSPDQNGSWDKAGLVRSIGRLAQGLFILLLFLCVWWRLNLTAPLRYVQFSSVLLLLMWVCSVSIVVERFLRYRVARNQSLTFVQQVVGALRNHDLDQAVAIAGRYRRSPLAMVVASGLASYQAAIPLLSDAEVIETAKRALRRSATVVHGELRRGLNLLASIASTAPLVGAFGTVMGIIYLYRGVGMAKSSYLAMMAGGLAEALLPTALGLLIGVLTVWCYKYLSSELEAFDIEVEKESLELVIYLTIILSDSRSNYLRTHPSSDRPQVSIG